jgi:hypothetical protein
MLIYNFADWTQWLEPQKVTFLPEQKLIKIHPGETQIDVQVDLYSAWKEWIRYYDNAKWSAAFTTFGGDPTGESQFAPRYFFLTNGWKVYVENLSVVVQMNLYSDDGESPFVIQNAAVTNRASDVPIIKSEVEKRLDYGDRIYVDINSSYAGTTYPNGTIAQPINNIPDAITLATLYNINNFYVLSDVTISDTGNIYEKYSIIADREDLTINIVDGNYLDSMEWIGFNINGYFGGGRNKFVDCTIQNAYDVSGQMKSCQINGNIRIWNQLVTSLCYSGIAGSGTPYWDMNETRETSLSIRSYSGGVYLKNCNQSGDTTTIELIAGQIKLDPTCSDGYIDLRGVGYLTNNSSGATVVTTGFIDSFENYIEESRATNEQLAYNNIIYIDQVSGYTGSTYPVGTIVQPVKYHIDIFALSAKYNILNWHILNDFYAVNTGLTFRNISFVGARENLALFSPGNKFIDCQFSNLLIDINFNYGTNNKINNSIIVNALNLNGNIINSQLGTPDRQSTMSIHQNLILSDCFSGNVGGFVSKTPIFDMIPGVESQLAIRNYSGGVDIRNCDTPESQVTIDLTGQAKFDSSCTDGFIDLRGVGYYTDNSGTGCTVKTDGFVNSFGSYIEESRAIDEQLAYGGKIYVDQISGSTGTTYPSGTIIEPVKEPFYLSSKLGIKDFWIVSDYTYTPTVYTKDIIITAAHPNINLTIQNGQYIDKSKFVGFYILDAEFDGNFNTYDKCIIFNTTNFHGHIYDSEIWGNISVHTHLDLWRCWADHHANITSIGTGVSFGVVNWSGDLVIKNSNINDEFLINMTSGKVILESGCTDGVIDLRGVGYLIDNSSGSTVITSGLVSKTLTSEDVAKLTGITSAIDDVTVSISGMTNSVNSLDEKVSYISGTTYEMNENVIIMTDGFAQIEDSISEMTIQVTSLEGQVKRILGLSQENFRIMNHTYSASNNLDSATVKIFNNSSDCDNDTNPLATYSMIALYDSSGRLVDYKVTKN